MLTKKTVGVGPVRRHQDAFLGELGGTLKEVSALTEQICDGGRFLNREFRVALNEGADLPAILFVQH